METKLPNPINIGRGRGRGLVKLLPDEESRKVSSPEEVLPPEFPIAGRGRGRGKINSDSEVLTKSMPQPMSPSSESSSSSIQEADIEIKSVSFSPEAEVRSICSEDGLKNARSEPLKLDEEEVEDEFASEEAVALLKLTNWGTIGFEKITGPVDPSKEESPSAEKSELQKTPIEIANEFREDTVLSPEPILSHIYCSICGVPAGKDAFVCFSREHPTCVECKTELNVQWCHYILTDSDGRFYCRSSLHKYKSIFRDFIYDNIQLSCLHFPKGCQYVGVWEDVKIHQQTCEFSTCASPE